MSETLPSPEPPLNAVEEKLKGVLSAMSDAVGAILSTTEIDRFGRVARLAVMGQKISAELVKTIKEAKKLRGQDARQAGVMGLLGPEGQYIAQGGGDINGYAEEMIDHNILNGNDMGAAIHPYPPAFVGDQTQLQRDLMMMVQEWFQDQKKQREHRDLPPAPEREAHLDRLRELNELFEIRKNLQAPADATRLLQIQKKIDALVTRIAEGDKTDDSPSDTTHVVSAELLRGHPPGAGEQWGDAGRASGPVLHREGRGEGPDEGGAPERDLEEAVG